MQNNSFISLLKTSFFFCLYFALLLSMSSVFAASAQAETTEPEEDLDSAATEAALLKTEQLYSTDSSILLIDPPQSTSSSDLAITTEDSGAAESPTEELSASLSFGLTELSLDTAPETTVTPYETLLLDNSFQSQPVSVDSSISRNPQSTLAPQPASTPEPALMASEEAPPGTESDRIVVRQFQFQGNTVFSSEELTKVTERFLGQVSFIQLLEARSAVTQFYVDRGYITSGAFIPEQDFSEADGIVKIQVVEGYLESISVDVVPAASDLNNPSAYPYISDNYVRSQLDVDTEHPFNIKVLQNSLRVLQQNPLIASLNSTLSTSSRPGLSRLTIRIDQRPIRGLAGLQGLQLSLDNNRSPSVGSLRFRFQYNLIPPLYRYMGEEYDTERVVSNTYLAISVTEGSQSIDFGGGWSNRTFDLTGRFGNTASTVIESPFEDLAINSPSTYIELTGRFRPVSNSREEFAIGGTYAWEQSLTSVQGIKLPISPGADERGRSRSSTLQAFLEWTRRSSWEAFYLRSQVTVGTGLFGTINNSGPDSRFLAWRSQGQWVARLAPDTLFILRGDIQLSNDSLLVLDQFSLGGQQTIRGYRQDQLLADEGVLVSAELRLPLLRLSDSRILLQVIPFIDFGSAWNDSDRPDPEPSTLWSAGLGLQLQMSDRLTARLDWGIPFVSVKSLGNTLQENGIYFSILWNPF